MKRTLAGLLCGSLLWGNVWAADYEMAAVRTEADYDYGREMRMIAQNEKTGEIIPLSECENGYCYAWTAPGEPVRFTVAESGRFSDYEAEEYQPNGASSLAYRNVVRGDENGALNEYDLISRSEAAAMLCRIGRFGSVQEAGFLDVGPDAWFYEDVCALAEQGVLAKDTFFIPNRTVTRQELVTMLYRLCRALGGKMAPAADSPSERWGRIQDFSEVQEYAREAYLAFEQNGFHLPSDLEEGDIMDTADDRYFLSPDTEMTRGEVIGTVYDFIRWFLIANRPAIAQELAGKYGLALQMPVIDGSTSTLPMTEAAYNMLFINPRNHPDYPQAHSKTTNSYKKLIRGEADVILVPDAGEEVESLADEHGVELVKTPIAAEGFIFFTGKDNPADGINSGDVEKIYVENTVTNWNQLGGPDATFAAFCRNNDSGSHAQMEKFFLEGREIHPDIRRERTSVMMSSILTDVEDYEREHPGSYALGYSMYYYYQNSKGVLGADHLKLLAVDGVLPDEASLQNGIYPLSIHYYAVTRGGEPADSPAKRFVEFLTSEAGQMCMLNAGFGSLAGIE